LQNKILEEFFRKYDNKYKVVMVGDVAII